MTLGADGRAGHREVDIDAEPDRFSVSVLALEQQRTGLGIARPRHAGGRHTGRPGGLQIYEQRGEGDQQDRGAFGDEKQQELGGAPQAGPRGSVEFIEGSHGKKLREGTKSTAAILRERAPLREHNDRQCSAAAGRRPAWRGAAVRAAAVLCGNVRLLGWRGIEGSRDDVAGQAAFRRAEPTGGGAGSRRTRPPPHLAPDAGRAGQTQPFDAGKSARRPQAFYARHHGAAGAGARRSPAQGQGARGSGAGRREWRGLARRPRRLFAPRGHLARRHLHHGAALVRRQGGDLRLPHRYCLGCAVLIAGVPRGRTPRCRLHPVWRGRGAEPVRPHLSRHQPPWPAPPDHGVAPDDPRRDVRHHHHAARRPRFAADADRRTDCVPADQADRQADVRARDEGRCELRDLSRAFAPDDGRAVRAVHAGVDATTPPRSRRSASSR